MFFHRGKYATNALMIDAIDASGAEVVTVAVRRVDLDRSKDEGILHHLDPSRYFPWKRLAQQGFGLWCDAPAAAVASGFDGTLALQAFGFDVSDPAAAAAAFRRHFRGEDRPGAVLDDAERAVLACLLELKRR